MVAPSLPSGMWGGVSLVDPVARLDAKTDLGRCGRGKAGGPIGITSCPKGASVREVSLGPSGW